MTDAPCANCGTGLPEGFRFCPACGAAVTQPATEVRKTVTLLFCDVSGSTALGEQLDPEVLRTLMGRYFAVARAAVERHGGLVEKFVGDAVLAVFGIPVVREDDPLRAVRAAAELRDALVDLGAELATSHGVHLAVRTGVNTGAVVAGADRAGGAFATGDAVNTAARLEQAAPPGEVLLGPATYRLVRDAVEVEPLAPLAVKGKAELLPAFRLLRVLDVDGGRSRRPDAALVGREREQRALAETMDRVVADGRAHLVTVLGPAGIGKTRLLAEVENGLDPTVQVLHGRCLSYGKGITFWPLVSVLRQAAGLVGEESPDKGRAVLLAALDGLEDAAAVVDRLAPLLGLAGEPAGSEETFWAVRTMLEHLADRGPLVIVLDDLHWAEPSLLDLLERLRDEVRDVPLLLVCPARPELLEQRPGWGGGAVNATSLLLEPLTAGHTAGLLEGLLGPGLPPEVSEAVNRWGDGNPLFLEEVTTHLIEEGVLVRSGDGWTLTGDLQSVSVPPTVTALLSARLDRLPPAERSLLEHASVIGLEVTAAEVDALLGSPDVPALLAALTRKGLLRRLRTPRGETFAFRHVLVREAAYEAVPKGQRAVLHERYADLLRDIGADAGGELQAFVGHHLEQAARLQRELTPGLAAVAALEARAAEALAAAGERARHADDNQTACALFERSLALQPRAPSRRRTLLQLAWSRGALWSTTLARAAVDEALTLGPPGPPDLDQLALEVELAVLRLQAGEHLPPVEAVALGERAEAAAQSAGDDRIRCHAIALQITGHWMTGRWAPVLSLTERMLQIGLPAERTHARHMWLAAQAGGRLPYEQVLELDLADEPGPIPFGLRAHLAGLRATALAALGRAAEQDAELAVALDLFRAAGRQETSLWWGLGAEVREAAGDGPGAIAHRRAEVDTLRRDGGLAYASTALGILAALLVEQGEDAEAGRTIDEAAAVTSPYDAVSLVLVDGVRAVLAARAGDGQTAQELLERTLRTLEPLDLLAARGYVTALLAEVPARRGDVEGQRRLLTQALQAHRQKEWLTAAAHVEEKLAALGP